MNGMRVLTDRQLAAFVRAHHGELLVENRKLKERVRQLEARLELWQIRWKNRQR